MTCTRPVKPGDKFLAPWSEVLTIIRYKRTCGCGCNEGIFLVKDRYGVEFDQRLTGMGRAS